MTQSDRPPTVDDVARQCVAVRLRMLNRVVTRIYDDALRPLGLKVSQLNVLVATAQMGSPRPSTIGERLQLDPSTLSRNIERMKARGWLEVVPDDDGRSQPIRLTDQGHALLQNALPAWDQAQRHVTQLLGEPLVKELHHALPRLQGPQDNS